MAILTSAGDQSANGEQTQQLAARWQRQNPGRVSIDEFPKALSVPHNMIDPNQPDAQTQITYSKVLELLRIGGVIEVMLRSWSHGMDGQTS